MATDDPDKLKGPGGLTIRQIHDQVRKSAERDGELQSARSPRNRVAQPQTRWQRFMRYVWGRSGRR